MKKANELDLYDMSGNIYDWLNTAYDSHYNLRGGAWAENHMCSVEYSFDYVQIEISTAFGFRLTRFP